VYRQAFGDEANCDAFQAILFWDVFAPGAAQMDAGGIHDEMRGLDALASDAEGAPKSKREMLGELQVGEPCLIFARAVATARELHDAIAHSGIVTSKAIQPPDALDAFRRGRIDTLVCTDLASEGLNLQRAGVVVHYDIPWNPVKLDQRNGRTWRIGQQRPLVRAIYFLPKRDRSRVLPIVASKNRTRRRMLAPRSSIASAASTL